MIDARRVLPFVLVVALAAVALITATAGAAKLPGLLTYEGAANASGFKVRPKTIAISGDGSNILGGVRHGAALRWSSWTATEALGGGSEYIDNCKPNCASGTVTPYPVTLRGARPRTVGGVLAFTRLTVTFTGKLPGRVRTSTLSLQRIGQTFAW